VKQVVQGVSGGEVRVLDVPAPAIGPTEVLVATSASIVSVGTERAMTALARSGLVAKARARPDLVRQVAAKAHADGLPAAARAVRSRLATDLPLGYSAAGVALEVGVAVAGIRPGDLVSTGGAGKAGHAEYQAVPGLLCSRVPAGVPPQDAAFATVASIALHGLRLAEVGTGAKVVVIGLGLIGQLAARLARASGCDVAGIDVADLPLRVARADGVLALRETGAETTARILSWSRGRGADAVLICAAGRSSEAVLRAPAIARDRAPVVVIGDVGLDLDRAPFYERELSLRFARSYGPGRYEPGYEDWGVDYPAGQVRWTQGRNAEAVLDLLATGHLRVADLVTHAFDIADAPRAYALVSSGAQPCLAVRFDYPAPAAPGAPVRLRAPTPTTVAPARRGARVGWLGAGAFSTGTLLPAFRAAGFDDLVSVASASGLSARRFAERHGFARAVAGPDGVLDDPDVDVVVIATPHDSHAELAVRALERGKHVWCEKPVALSLDELDAVEKAAAAGGGVLFVGFNRRWSADVTAAAGHLRSREAPLTLLYRAAAGPVPARHWYADRRHGGRLLGEVCHFIDTCAALSGSPVTGVTALAGGEGESLLAADLAVSLRHGDGGLASIAYSSARPRSVRKESVEAFSGTRHLRIDDYRELTVDGRPARRGPQDKGHHAAVRAFHRAVRDGHADVTADLLASSRATVLAAATLTSTGQALAAWPDLPAGEA
jgi:predicted dehydrogenase/threonine dehydrogenase-like Zn-dependent dehydrogenase